MLAFLIASMLASVIQVIGNPTGASLFSHATNIGKATAVTGIEFFGWTLAISALLSFLYIPLPRLLLGSFSYLIYKSATILIDENSGTLFSYIVSFSYGLLCLLITIFLIVLFHRKMRHLIKLAILIGVIFSIYLVFHSMENKTVYRELPALSDTIIQKTMLKDPSKKGDYPYTFLTYGSGNDKHREGFGKGVNITTPTVDASDFITKWGEKREAFWGFDQGQLPVNARVWLPEGEGPFPVVLMVHGNHTMEYFSTAGYDYLGELLASRGVVAASVDEDFINYSNVSGSPNNNYELRAWMLLQHLVQLEKLNQTPGNELYEKIDLTKVGLVGHSRGGQAVSMVADYDRFFQDERLSESMENIQIKGVVALAPTDKKVDGKRPRLDNASYLLIQGAQDADINNFRGDRQFYRTTLDKDDHSFKASLYIEGANHSQFNTEWGSMDMSLPKGLFLNRMQLMKPEDQRQIAKVYISAFFERTLHENTAYESLFRDYQFGRQWLPDSQFVSKYQNSSYFPLLEFKRTQPAPANGITIDTEGFTESEIITPKDRRDNKRLEDAVQLEWENNAEYSLHLPNDFSSNEEMESLNHVVFTMANGNNEDKNKETLELEIELETTDGVSVTLPLAEFMPFPPVISTEFTPFGLFDEIFRDGKYEKSWEPVFQTFEIPLSAYEKEHPAFNKSNLNQITLHITTHPGKIIIENIGLSQ